MGKMEVRSLRSNGGSPLEEEEEEVGTKLFPWMRKKKREKEKEE